MMTTFVAHSLTETRITDDQCRFEMTFVDARGERHAISIPSGIAADLVPVLEALVAARQDARQNLHGYRRRLRWGTPLSSTWC